MPWGFKGCTAQHLRVESGPEHGVELRLHRGITVLLFRLLEPIAGNYRTGLRNGRKY